MKKLSKIYYTIGMIVPVLLSSCSDNFLDRPPQDRLTAETFYKNDEQVLASTALLYNNVWFDYNDKASYNLGDFRGGTAYSAWNDRTNVEFNTTGDTGENGAAWRAFFNVVGQSNLTIQNIQKNAGVEVTAETKKFAIAEARFMRSLAYRYIVMNWGPVPVIENNLNLIDDPKVKPNTVQSVWKFITKEMRAVSEDLPETSPQVGRVNKWAAEAMLARFYLTRAGVESTGGVRNQQFLDSAKYYAKRVIDAKGSGALLTNYEDLFKQSYDNNSESIFELQWVVTDNTTWGTQNSTPAYLAYDASIGNGDGWGGDKGASLWILEQYEGLIPRKTDGTSDYGKFGSTPDQRLKATYMLPGFKYPEVMQKVGSTEQALVFPTNSSDVSFASIKKYVTGKATKDIPAYAQRYSHDTYMMRLAEVYLIYAEAELGNQASTSDGLALQYFNRIHTRAGLDPVNSGLTYDMIFKERILEFAMEGMAWYDLVHLHYFNEQKAYDIISAQDRGFFAVKPDQFPNATKWAVTPTGWNTTNRKFVASSSNFQLPLPNSELSVAPWLKDEPVDYFAGK
jgi:starch-binding outer membrane protein, SusD/RagB family